MNDHALKQLWPGLITGKLSDFAGLVFFPLFLQGAWEVASSTFGRGALASPRVLLIAIVATGVGFASMKVIADIGYAYRIALGVLQWLVAAPVLVLTDHPAGMPAVVNFTADPTDLVALPVLALAWLAARHRALPARS